MWKQSGKPRGDVTECDMQTSRLRFKYALRQCQSNNEIMRADLKLITVTGLLVYKLIVAHLKHCSYVCTCHVIAVRIMMILCFT